MKKMTLLLSFLTFAGCTCSNSKGDCIGLANDPVPGVTYKASTRNIVLGIVFSETVVVPAVVVLTDLKCPVEE